jgi:hypothetical protein
MSLQLNKENTSVDYVEVCVGHKESISCIDVNPTLTKVILNFDVA